MWSQPSRDKSALGWVLDFGAEEKVGRVLNIIFLLPMVPIERKAGHNSVAPVTDGGLPSEAGAVLVVPHFGSCSSWQMPAVNIDPEPGEGKGGLTAAEAGGLTGRPRVY